MPEIQNMMVLSTGHFSKETLQWLTDIDWTCEGPAGGDIPYGWFLYAHDDNMTYKRIDGKLTAIEFPPDLWACFEYARKHHCHYIRFDCDLETVDDLPSYEH